MSKIEEIRKRHQERQAGEEPADYSLAFEEAHEDRAALLAALDGEWQSEIPTEGRWHLAVPPDVRAKWGDGFSWPMAVDISVGGTAVIYNLHYNPRGVAAPLFTGALWQRRTVPGDPFKGGGE
jgi:hypothetical protein